MNRFLLPTLSLGLLLTLAACKDDDETIPDTTLDLSSQFYTDINANPIGQSGMPEDFQPETWAPWVRELFAPLDTTSLPVCDATADSIRLVALFPNPAQSVQGFVWRGEDSVNVKLVLVNSKRQALLRATTTPA